MAAIQTGSQRVTVFAPRNGGSPNENDGNKGHCVTSEVINARDRPLFRPKHADQEGDGNDNQFHVMLATQNPRLLIWTADYLV